MGFGWGTVAGFIADRFPSRKEGLRNKADKLRRQIDDLTKSKQTAGGTAKFLRLTGKLRAIEQRLENS